MMDKAKYFYIQYHEFLEYIARISIEAFSTIKGMDHQVFNMLDLLYEVDGIKDYTKAYEINPDIDLSL
jgi:hypothetical protein